MGLRSERGAHTEGRSRGKGKRRCSDCSRFNAHDHVVERRGFAAKEGHRGVDRHGAFWTTRRLGRSRVISLAIKGRI